MKKLLIAILLLLVAGAVIGYFGHTSVFSPNVLVGKEDKVVFIPRGSDYDSLLKVLKDEEILHSEGSFDRVASWMKYKGSDITTGRYTIKAGWNNKELVSLLRSGRQTPVKMTFNNLRTKEDLAGKISAYLELDSLELVQFFQDEKVHKEAGLNNETFLTLFIPNTYEVFWNITKENLVSRMKKEHKAFWSKDNRAEKAKKLGLSKEEVYTLASIVEKESQRNAEKPTLAGVYLNRIRIGMPLQADPTLVFAIGDFGLRRVLNVHKETESPYNTYKYTGLPPGPIYMSSIPSIDAVLNRKDHNYLYFCASPEIQGAHLFAETLSRHNANARRYHRWLNSQGIR